MSLPGSLRLVGYRKDCPPAFLGSLSPAVSEAFEKVSLLATYPEAAFLVNQGQEPRGVFVISKGRVKVSMASAEGKTVILRIAKPGEMIGLPAVISGEPHRTSAATMVLSEVHFVRRNDFLGCCARIPRLFSKQPSNWAIITT